VGGGGGESIKAGLGREKGGPVIRMEGEDTRSADRDSNLSASEEEVVLGRVIPLEVGKNSSGP